MFFKFEQYLREVADPDVNENLMVCPICGETAYKADCRHIGDELVCPSCYGSKENRMYRLVKELDDYDIELLTEILEGAKL